MTIQLTEFQLTVLIALVEKGPIWDGDIQHRVARDDLIADGLAVRIVRKGEDGWTAATYKGRDAYLAQFLGETLPAAMAAREAMRAIESAAKP